MILWFLMFALIAEFSAEEQEGRYKYTISINPFSFMIFVEEKEPPFILTEYLPTPAINFEIKFPNIFSVNFEINNLFFVYPVEIEIGIREYLRKNKDFQGLYFYQGIALRGLKTRDWEIAGKYPHFILTVGYKFTSRIRLTLDPFFGIRIMSSRSPFMYNISPFSYLSSILGLYLGYSW
jgi:hypothetical protein